MTWWILFWGCLGILFYIYVGYVLLLRLISHFFPIQHTPIDSYTPPVTLIFAAHNERASLPRKIQSLKDIDYPRDRLQILIASDASTDGTNEYIQEHADIELISLEQHSGKNAALNAGMQQATGEILFFTDANTLLHPQCIRRAVRHFANHQVGMVTGELTFTLQGEWNAVGQGTGLYWRYESGIKRSENRLGSVLVGCGSLLMVRRELVPPLDPRVANDLEIPARVGAEGNLVLYEPEFLGYEKPHTEAGEELQRTSRIVARGVRGFVVLFPLWCRSPLRLWQFVSHKVLRWFTLIFAAGLYLSSLLLFAESAFAAGIFILSTLFLLLAIVGIPFLIWKKLPRFFKPSTILSHLLLMHVGATWGIWKALTGQTPATWSIPQSSRDDKSRI